MTHLNQKNFKYFMKYHFQWLFLSSENVSFGILKIDSLWALCGFFLSFFKNIVRKTLWRGQWEALPIGTGTTVMQFAVGEIVLNSEYSVSKWEFIAEEQGEDQWVENY